MDNDEVLKLAKERSLAAKEAWSEIYRKAREDLHFLSDEPYAQWDEKEAADRTKIGRPALQIDQLTQFIHQVSNDIRMNTPTIKVIPDSMDSKPETAEAIAGRIKAIEYKSNADAAYDMAADFAVKSSLGYIRVDHGFIDQKSFNQELKICRVTNPLSILIDPDSTEPDGSDAKYGFVYDEISVKDFQDKYPDATPVGFGDENPKRGKKTEDKIIIAEYFCIIDDETEIGLLPDGTSEPVQPKKKYSQKRKITKPLVKHYTLAGENVLEETTFPGKYIPLVPVYGEEAWENGVRKLHSLIRKSKQAQQMYNLWKSLETELLLKQQQAPVQAAVGQMRGFEQDWKQPDKAMVLYYNQTDVEGNEAPAPQRLQPPTIPTGIVNASQGSANNIRETLGMYNASAGKREGDSSGVALKELDKSSDVGNYHFGDNLVRSITHIGKIIVCALPEVEDTARIVNTISPEDEHKPIGINGEMAEGQEHHYDFTKGEYDVRVVTGPSYTTQRQEAAASYAQIIQSMPDLMPVIGDLVFKYQDAPGSQAISARLKKLVDPKLLDDSEREENQPDPQVMQLTAQLQQVTQEAQQQIQALQAELGNKQGDMQLKAGELEIKQQELKIKEAELQLKAQQSQAPQGTPMEADQQAFDQSIKERELQLKEAEFQLKLLQAHKSEAPEGADMTSTDETIEMLQAKIQQKLQQKQSEEEANFAKQQQDQQLAEQQAQEMQMKAAQTQAVIDALSSISAQLNNLTATVSQPITVMRDEAGNLIGAA